MDMAAIRKRKRELMGQSRPSDARITRNELAIVAKLASKSIPVTRRNVLIERMALGLEEMPETPHKAFYEAIKEMYDHCIPS